MADEKPVPPRGDSKEDTVRINLPPGGPVGAAPPGGPATVKLKFTPPGAPSQIPEEKEATAIIGRTPSVGKPKTDTSPVDISTAKPAAPAVPRPALKVRREGAPVAAAPAKAAPSGAAAVPSMAAAVAPGVTAESAGGMENGLAIAAVVLALAVTAYLAYVAFLA